MTDAPPTASPDAAAIRRALADPFPPHLVRWLPKAKVSSNGRRPCVPYVEFATVIDRLDAVLGLDGWQSRSSPAGDGAAVCELTVRIGGEWITRTDVGAAGPKDDAGNRLKAAFTDALKRAAAKFGIGRYLAHVPRPWLDYDEARKRVVGVGHLPAWAMPGGAGHPPAPPVDAKAATIVGNAIASSFQGAADAIAFSVARLAYLQAAGAGRIGDSQRAVIRGSRKNAAERLKIHDAQGWEDE